MALPRGVQAAWTIPSRRLCFCSLFHFISILDGWLERGTHLFARRAHSMSRSRRLPIHTPGRYWSGSLRAYQPREMTHTLELETFHPFTHGFEADPELCLRGGYFAMISGKYTRKMATHGISFLARYISMCFSGSYLGSGSKCGQLVSLPLLRTVMRLSHKVESNSLWVLTLQPPTQVDQSSRSASLTASENTSRPFSMCSCVITRGGRNLMTFGQCPAFHTRTPRSKHFA